MDGGLLLGARDLAQYFLDVPPSVGHQTADGLFDRSIPGAVGLLEISFDPVHERIP